MTEIDESTKKSFEKAQERLKGRIIAPDDENYQTYKNLAEQGAGNIISANVDLLDKEDINYSNLNQGVFKDKWHYGKVVIYNDRETEAIITSDKELLVNKSEWYRGKQIGNNEIKEAGVEYRHELEVTKNFWSNESSKRFLMNQAEKIDKKELFNKIKDKILYYMDLLDERIANLATCFVIGSYFYELFETYPYLYFNALRDSGKSKFKKILRLMSFNGEEASNISEASFFRTIENTKGVLCIDEYEKLDTDRKKLIDMLLNAGIEKGSTVKRQEKIGNSWKNRNFDVYCPKIICNITGLDPTTQSRCITIKLLKTTTSKGKRKPKQNNPEWQEIRDMCYIFVMQNFKEIKTLDENYSCEELKNRDEDLWRPILVIAKFIDDEIEKSLLDYSALNIQTRAYEEVETDWKYLLLKDMLDHIANEGWYTVKEMKGWVTFEVSVKSLERWIGRQLAIMPLFKHRYNPNSEYWISKELIINMMYRLNYPIPKEYDHLLDNSKNSNNISNSTNSNNSKNSNDTKVTELTKVSKVKKDMEEAFTKLSEKDQEVGKCSYCAHVSLLTHKDQDGNFACNYCVGKA